MTNARFASLALLLASMVAVCAHGQTFSVLYDFGTKIGDPYQPYVEIVTQGRDGNLYSTASQGGANGVGAVYKITQAGAVKVLHSFSLQEGLLPFGGLTLGTDGNFYGTTYGGSSDGNPYRPYGTIFKVTPSGQLTYLYTFTNGTDGAFPYAPPVEGTDGNFYGTTTSAGLGYGTIYKITPGGKFTTLCQFDHTHGDTPYAPLVEGTNGSFYGTTYYGGANGIGVIFKITGSGKFAVVYDFDDTHGSEPIGGLIQANDRNFYGTTRFGGSSGNGVVFKMVPSGKTLTVLHSMNATTDGQQSYAGIVEGTDGNFYGTNSQGGTPSQSCGQLGCGTLFKISRQGAFSVIHDFDYPTGSTPYTPMIQHTNGMLYGTTEIGGSGVRGTCTGCGVFYKLNAGLAPFAALLPDAGIPGARIQVLGQGFTGTTAVKFNGVPASFKVVEDTFLTAIVPAGATSGFVTVTTPTGTLTSYRKFIVR
jgi:uncharacterized repeat protein (TIGR03803 family)